MTAHRSLSDSELHTPKGADSATKNQFNMANGDGTTTFREFLTRIDSWDYSVDGAASTISFTSLDDYQFIVLEAFGLKTGSASNLDLEFVFNGSNSFENSWSLDGTADKDSGSKIFIGKLLDTSDTTNMCLKVVLGPLDSNAGKVITYSGFADANQWYGVARTGATTSKNGVYLTNSGGVDFTGGTVYLYGIKA